VTPEASVIENLLMIADKDGNDVPFTLNATQKVLDEHLTGRDLVPKARQEGVSSYFLARYLIKCLSKRNTRAVVISHDMESTQRMLSKVHYFLNNLRGPKAVVGHASKNEFTFPKTDSMFYLGTAGSRKFGRGDTITNLHCSEVAFWPDPKALLAGLFQAVPRTGEIALESTGNGVGNFYHNRVVRAATGKSRYKVHFFNWQNFPEYTINVTEEEAKEILSNLDPELEEDIVHERGLTPGQIAFRREKLDELDFDLRLFKQEYPMTLDECFQASGHSIFYKVLYKPTDFWTKVDTNLHLLAGHPDPNLHYVLGADVGGGVQQDNSIAEIVCLETMEQVAEWASNKLAPDIFAHKLTALGTNFNGAYMVIESNNHGIMTLSELRGKYPSHLVYRDPSTAKISESHLLKLGHRTTTSSRFHLIGLLRYHLARDLTIHSELLMGELSTFIEHDDGKLAADQDCLDDRVIALAEASFGLQKAGIMLLPQPLALPPTEPDPFSLEAIIDELRGRDNKFPIKPQHGVIDADYSVIGE